MEAQKQQANTQKEFASQNNPFGETVCIATGLVQLSSYLVGGK
jgi:hypothetical protein